MSLGNLMSSLANVGNEGDKSGAGQSQIANENQDLLQSQLELAEANTLLFEAESLAMVHEQAESQMLALQGLSDDITTICADGMTQREMALVNGSVNRYNQMVPAPFHVNFPGIESHSAGNRVHLTEVGNEAAKDRAKALAKWMSDLLVKVVEQIQKWVAKFFGGAERLKSGAAALAQKADGFEQKDDKKKISVSTKLLSVGSTAPSAGNFVGNLVEFTKVSGLIDTEYKLEKDALDAAIKAAEMSDAGKAVEAVGESGDYGKQVKAIADTAAPVEKDKLIGGKFIEVKDGRRMVSTSDTKVSKESVEIELIKPSDVVKGAEAIVEACDVVIGAKKLYGENKKIKDDSVKAAESLDKTLAEDSTTPEQKSELRALARALGNHSRRVISTGIHTSWAAHSVSVMQSAAGVLNKSLV